MSALKHAYKLAKNGEAVECKPKDRFSLFITHNQTNTATFLSWPELVKLSNKPTIGPKDKAKLITSFISNGKTKEHAEKAEHWALVIDHDHDDLTETQLKDKYEPYQVAYNAFTTSSHQQIDAKHLQAQNRWKAVIPLACSGGADQVEPIENGLALLFGADLAQANIQQGFYAPNKLTHDAPYSSFCEELYPMLDINDIGHPLIVDAFNALEKHEQEQTKQAEQAPAKPRDIPEQGGIIDKVNAADTLASLIEQYGYKRKRKGWLSPQSESGQAGVYILKSNDGKERLYSHHGETDPLSKLNHNGHSLDAFDVIVCLRFNGDTKEAVKVLANELDREENKQRQREHMANKNAPIADINALFDMTEETKPHCASKTNVDLLAPPGLAGEICKQMKLIARRPCPELYPFAALHLIALVGRKRKSIFTSKLNLITLAIAPTAAGKEKAQDAVKRSAHDQYCSNLIHGNAGSFKDLIYNLLDGDGASLYIVDEVHSFLGSMKSNNAQTYETKMEAEILTMNSTELYTFRGMEKRQLSENYQKQIKSLEKAIENSGSNEDETNKLNKALERNKRQLDWLENGLPDPFFSMMGHSVPERLDSFIKADNIASGFLGRTLVTRCPDTRAKLRRTQVDEHELALIEINIMNGLNNVRRGRDVIDVTDDAAEYLNSCIDWYEEDEQLNHHIAGGIYARAPEHLYRVATILALDEGTINLEHVRYADALVKQSINDVSYILLKAYNEADGAEEKQVIEHARQIIHRNCKGQGLPESSIKQLVIKPKGWKELQANDLKRDRFKELVETMISNEELEIKEDGRRKRYLSRSVV
tara:strand:+ start:11362 stop:13821 length:2460 start_codon:yes stop_codon:yes gene_type:complete